MNTQIYIQLATVLESRKYKNNADKNRMANANPDTTALQFILYDTEILYNSYSKTYGNKYSSIFSSPSPSPLFFANSTSVFTATQHPQWSSFA